MKDFLDGINTEVRTCRERFKFKRKEYGLGPQNLIRLCEDEAFINLASQKGIDLSYFQGK